MTRKSSSSKGKAVPPAAAAAATAVATGICPGRIRLMLGWALILFIVVGFEKSWVQIQKNAKDLSTTTTSTTKITDNKIMDSGVNKYKNMVQQQQQQQQQISTNQGLCDGYQGILHIASSTDGSQTGTFFFQYVLDSIIFAERNNLYPFIWIDYIPSDHKVFDPKIHAIRNAFVTPKPHPIGEIQTIYQHRDQRRCEDEPYKPIFDEDEYKLHNIKLRTNGIWQSYFEPTPIPFLDTSCQNKPVFVMIEDYLTPMHYCSDWSVKGWMTRKMSKDILPESQNITLDEWMYSHRQRAAPIVKKYFRPQPWLLKKIEENNP